MRELETAKSVMTSAQLGQLTLFPKPWNQAFNLLVSASLCQPEFPRVADEGRHPMVAQSSRMETGGYETRAQCVHFRQGCELSRITKVVRISSAG